ncbi:MAG TPA: class I mannose-6-phosphate isomerase [Allosphingosinicella sp.]|jgi:mannose-6-phosphate isomerase|uniref:class I mannose-6-phosphate isomerase n=1 Tax=Allosphingosinicella sp. TaxID=2823234 RepID=UPI002F28A5FA
MNTIRLNARRIEKPWGRRDIPAIFGSATPDGEPVGEVWFEDPRGGRPELLVKYLFTSQPLSIQVHPDAAAADPLGYPSGKDEAWLVLDAEPEAKIGIGLRDETDAQSLREAATDGSIERLVDWHPVAAGDSFYSPAGTVHSIGAGLSLIEVQQNVDVTFRLYDFGRARALQLDAALAVAQPGPYTQPLQPYVLTPGREILADGPAFVLERWRGPGAGMLQVRPGKPLWLVGVGRGGRLDGKKIEAGSAWLVEGSVELVAEPRSDLLIAYPGRGLRSFAAFAWETPSVLDFRRRRFRDSPKGLKKAG